jgi:hypothetical protein
MGEFLEMRKFFEDRGYGFSDGVRAMIRLYMEASK